MNKQKSPIERRNWILLHLRQQGRLAIEEIVFELKVSAMTIYRDVQVMATDGSVKRIHGGIILSDVTHQGTTCAACHSLISYRMQFLFTTATGANLAFCCPHCEPSVLSFKNRDQAEAFCRGFGGSVFNIHEAINFLLPGKPLTLESA